MAPLTSIAQTKRAVSELRGGTNVEFVLKDLRLLTEKEYADRALSIAREWAVALSLWRGGIRGEVKVRDCEPKKQTVEREEVARHRRTRAVSGRRQRRTS